MAVTQYVGARYVPLFADPLDWDNERTYEPLTIVYYQGNSYTSRQYVPSGIDISNDEYWALTGNYNAQIEQYRQEVAAFDGRITSAQEAAEGAQSTADAVTSTVDGITPFDTTPTEGSVKGVTSGGVYDALDGFETEVNSSIDSFKSETNATIEEFKGEVSEDIEEVNSNVSQLETTIRNVAEKDIVVVCGDSFTTTTSTRTTTWLTLLSDEYNFKNYAISGTGFDDGGSSGTGQFINQLQQAIDDDSYDHSLVKTVLCYGGYNDFINGTSEESEDDLIWRWFSTAKQNFPGADVKIVFGNSGIINREAEDGYMYWIESIGRAHSSGNILPITNAMFWLYGWNPEIVFDSGDELHPNSSGMAVIARYMAQVLEGTYTGKDWITARLGAEESYSTGLYIHWNASGDLYFSGRYTQAAVSEAGGVQHTFASLSGGRFCKNYNQPSIAVPYFATRSPDYLRGVYLDPTESSLTFQFAQAYPDGTTNIYF